MVAAVLLALVVMVFVIMFVVMVVVVAVMVFVVVFVVVAVTHVVRVVVMIVVMVAVVAAVVAVSHVVMILAAPTSRLHHSHLGEPGLGPLDRADLHLHVRGAEKGRHGSHRIGIHEARVQEGRCEHVPGDAGEAVEVESSHDQGGSGGCQEMDVMMRPGPSPPPSPPGRRRCRRRTRCRCWTP